MSLPKDLIREYPGLGDWCILMGFRGSVAHGTYVAPTEPTGIDDKDIHAVCVPPRGYYLGLRDFGSRGTQEVFRDPWDVVTFEARKAVRMFAQGNPNILALLWMPENMYLKVEPAGRLLLDNRDLFVGKHVYKPFIGYATGQLRKMTHLNYEGYMGAKRKALVDKFGYDTKNGAHLIRLLRMGIEFLTDGELNVHRHDAQDFIAIKNGEWSLEKVQREADRLFVLAQEAHVRSTLPVRPDMAKVNELCCNVVGRAWADRIYEAYT